MKPWRTVDTRLERGRTFSLKARGEEFLIQVDGQVLMGSRRHGSEEELATAGCERLHGAAPSLLVGGLGFGFTLRAALDRLAPRAQVVVRELSGAVAEWNQGPLAHFSGRALSDPRVRLEVGDVQEALTPDRFDAILLDVDNGPFAVSHPANAALYGPSGVAAMGAALRRSGRLVIWSASDDARFKRRLSDAGLRAETRGTQGSGHVLFIADR